MEGHEILRAIVDDRLRELDLTEPEHRPDAVGGIFGFCLGAADALQRAGLLTYDEQTAILQHLSSELERQGLGKIVEGSVETSITVTASRAGPPPPPRQPDPILVQPFEGEKIFGDPAPMWIRVPADRTGGVISFVESRMPPRSLIPGHVHENNDVWVYVLEGRVGVRVGEAESVGRRGSWLLKPRGVPHAMWNPADEPNRFLEVLTPGSGEMFFRAVAGLPDDAPEDAFDDVSAEHGIRWFDDWTDDLKSRFGLRRMGEIRGDPPTA